MVTEHYISLRFQRKIKFFSLNLGFVKIKKIKGVMSKGARFALRKLNEYSRRMEDVFERIESRLPEEKKTKKSIHTLRDEYGELNDITNDWFDYASRYSRVCNDYLRSMLHEVVDKYDYLDESCRAQIVYNLIKEVFSLSKFKNWQKLRDDMIDAMDGHISRVNDAMRTVTNKQYLEKMIKEVLEKKNASVKNN